MKRCYSFIITILCVLQASAQNVIGEETYEDYRLQRYSDGTSKIFDKDQNWIQFYTEYKKDRYTGEITNNPIEIQRFLGWSEDKWLPDIFGAVQTSKEEPSR